VVARNFFDAVCGGDVERDIVEGGAVEEDGGGGCRGGGEGVALSSASRLKRLL